MAPNLSFSFNLRHCTLAHCGIGDAGAAAIAGALPASLNKFDIASNDISALGLAEVAAALRVGQTPLLTHLDLSGNEIGAGGGAELAEALPVGTPLLENLDLRGCFLADPGLAWLAGASTRPLLNSA
jgi:hypothetical protein